MAIILVVDDDPTIRTIAAELLRAEQHAIIEAGDGDEALRVLDATHAELVVLDMLMPNRDGLETILEIRRRHPGVRILAISSGGSIGVGNLLNMARVFGADETLAKPLSFSTFAATVNRLLERPANDAHLMAGRA
ncbi:MAG: response regulator [Brevundimonas sp.]|jgi:DNA-binding response OmpR family regulator|uniref:response regulator n=1 Tax=Brevundimonas sp. TaxID=1871086 RepID=UPI0017BEF0C8|nr:response regulator [Brevundimonas sp.]MBA4805441.1 response regulator [Brevundimonas sp.]